MYKRKSHRKTFVYDGERKAPKNVVDVLVADGVTEIRESAFFECCSSLETITFPSSIATIGRHAFSNCSFLKTVTIPSSITTICDWAFYECSSLKTLTLPSSITAIGYRAFQGCSSLKTVTLLSPITTISDSTFAGCFSLTSITIPSSITAINFAAFFGCTSLTTITLPLAITTIGKWAFRECSSLTTINVPSSITRIAENAFDKCSGLRSIELGNRTTNAADEDGDDGGNSLLLKALERQGHFHLGTSLEILLGYSTTTDMSYYHYNWCQTGRLPLAIVAEHGVPWSSPRSNNGGDGSLPKVLREDLAAIEETDSTTGLSMFMLAAVGDGSDFEAVYRLLVEYPILPVTKE